MVRCFAIEAGKIVENGKKGSILVYTSPTESENQELVDAYKIDAHNLQSSLDPDERGRMEFDQDHLVLILKRPRAYSSADDLLFRVVSLGVFMFREKMVVVTPDDIPLFDWKQPLNSFSLHDALLKLIYTTIAHFMGHLRVINRLSDAIEDRVYTSTGNRVLENMFTLEKSLVYYLNAINDNATMIGKLKLNAAKIGFTPEHLELLDDIIIDNAQCLTLTQTYSNILSSLMDARASVINNNLNVMMKNLNAVAIAVAVPTFFAGVGGMSEFTMMTGASRWLIAYPIFLAITALSGVGAYYLIRKWEKYWNQN